MKSYFHVFMISLFLAAAPAASAETLRVIDGDGFWLGSREIRLWGIDAPERAQECVNRAGQSYLCGNRSKSFLVDILGDSVPICRTLYRDKYKRHISRCSLGGHDLAGMVVSSGWALDYPRYSGGAYRLHQDHAKRAGRGLWQGAFVEPWTWRSVRKK